MALPCKRNKHVTGEFLYYKGLDGKTKHKIISFVRGYYEMEDGLVLKADIADELYSEPKDCKSTTND